MKNFSFITSLFVVLFLFSNVLGAQDSDGFINSIDLDDDNDGILDCDESEDSVNGSFVWSLNTPPGNLNMDSVDNPKITDWVLASTTSLNFDSGKFSPGTSTQLRFSSIASNNFSEAISNNDYVEMSFTTSSEVSNLILKDIFTGWYEPTKGDSFYSASQFSEGSSGVWTTLSQDIYNVDDGTIYAMFDNMIIPEIRLKSNTVYTFRFYVYGREEASSIETYSIIDDFRFYIEACKSQDSDNDTIPDHLDLDSDNDGCPDALEGNAGLQFQDLNLNGSINATVNDNGIPIVTNVGTVGAGTVGQNDVSSTDSSVQAVECDSCNATSTRFVDTDNDTYGNDCDLDDDNDGILDTDECGLPLLVGSVSGEGTNSISGTFESGVMSSDFSLSSPSLVEIPSGNPVPVEFSLYTTNVTDGVLISWDEGYVNPGNVFDVAFVLQEAQNGKLSSLQVGNNARSSSYGAQNANKEITITWPGGSSAVLNDPLNEILNYPDGSVITSGTVLDCSSGGVIIRDSEWYIDIDLEGATYPFNVVYNTVSSVSTRFEGVAFMPVGCLDSDGDSIINSLDTDSDSDGCPDALEGDALNSEIGYSNLNNNNQITGGVDGNGVPNAANGGQNIGTSIDNTQQANECNTCDINNPNFIDTDKDGVGNDCDLDDDNDGILDNVEHPKTLLWVKRGLITSDQQNTIDKLINLGFSVTISNDTQSQDVDNFSVTYVHPTVNSGIAFANIANLATSTKGVITSENALFDEIMGTTGVESQPVSSLINITNNTHPITQGLPLGDLDIGDGSYIVANILTGTHLGTHPNGTVSMIAWEVDEPMENALAAPGRRVAVPHTSYNGGLNAVGENLLVRAILWTWAKDSDRDGFYDHLDIDSDNDGIPDNVEAQPTVGYIPPDGTTNITTGIDLAYGSGLVSLEDTDSDGIPDYLDLDTDGDGVLDINENGMSGPIMTFVDNDSDGLDNSFETTSVNDVLWDVNEDIEDPTNVLVLPDTDGDLALGGDLDYRDLLDVYFANGAIDFDGVDDYLDSTPFITDWTAGTIMAWIKIEHTSTGNLPNLYSIAGQESMRLFITNGRTPAFCVITQDQVTASDNFPDNNIQVQPDPLLNIKLENDLWYHVTGVFNSADQTVKLYLNGELVGSEANTQLNSELITKNFNGSAHIYATREFTIGRYPTNTSVAGSGHFNGNIDEVRIFDYALSDHQIQQMVYQEIENNSGYLRGSVIPKDIQDLATAQKVSWSNLKAYFPMVDIVNDITTDYSSFGNDVTLHNITTIQDQTAPMPYITLNDGDWLNQNTWLHGDVWDIKNAATNKDWSIVEVKHDITASHEVKTLGLIIDNDKTLTINGNNQVENSWYFELNGTLDLLNDSQLIQTQYSDLVTNTNGNILRRQEGTSNPFWYNYWGSPVGVPMSTALIDNNTTSNNPNNTPFSLNMLKDETGTAMSFTSNYSGNESISSYWLYTFKNGITYWDWEKFNTSAAIYPGVGYTQKGTGSGDVEQQYIFDGKPNNGTIVVNVADLGGTGSIQNVTKTAYLLANPYPSALDIHKFIDDNEGVINGYVELWQQWSGASHILKDYNGGYAQVNKTGTIRASQFIGIEGNDTGGLEGTKMPTRYMPVGQGFMAEIENNGVLPFDGTVEFNNNQRVFIKETSYSNTGPYDQGSLFTKSELVKVKNGEDKEVTMQKIRLEFKSLSGPNTKRELLLGFSDFTTDNYDYGYDAKNANPKNNDLNLELNGEPMNIQAYGPITVDKIVPLNFSSSGPHDFEIRVSETENILETQNIYIHDKLTGAYFNLSTFKPYTFSSKQGIFNERFKIVFQNESEVLSIKHSMFVENNIFYKNSTNTLFVKKLESPVSKLSLVNMRGQVVLEMTDLTIDILESGVQFSNVSTGAYIVYMRTNSNNTLVKKIIVR
ncbi:LamG-like jellyroll fold domain-containing protein [Algibacter pectinivorans]|nr:LamG-like jellyroll fold domain-containing protein [Algibacter pectinivorans]